jgi:hypothetical protein
MACPSTAASESSIPSSRPDGTSAKIVRFPISRAGSGSVYARRSRYRPWWVQMLLFGHTDQAFLLKSSRPIVRRSGKIPKRMVPEVGDKPAHLAVSDFSLMHLLYRCKCPLKRSRRMQAIC